MFEKSKQKKESIKNSIQIKPKRSKYDGSLNLLLVSGNSAQGSSSLLDRFVGREFDVTRSFTLGVEFGAKEIFYQGLKIKLQIWDASGHERFRENTEYYLKRKDCFLMVQAINEQDSVLSSNWLDSLGFRNTPRLLAFTKTDLENERTILPTDYPRLLKHSGAKHGMECSAKTGEGVEAVFLKAVELCLDRKRVIAQKIIKNERGFKFVFSTLLSFGNKITEGLEILLETDLLTHDNFQRLLHRKAVIDDIIVAMNEMIKMGFFDQKTFNAICDHSGDMDKIFDVRYRELKKIIEADIETLYYLLKAQYLSPEVINNLAYSSNQERLCRYILQMDSKEQADLLNKIFNDSESFLYRFFLKAPKNLINLLKRKLQELEGEEVSSKSQDILILDQNSIHHSEEDIFMKENIANQDREIKLLKTQYQELLSSINKMLESRDYEIEQLKAKLDTQQLEITFLRDKELKETEEKLSKTTSSDIQIQEMEILKKQVEDQRIELEQLLSVQNAVPKLLDGLVAQGNIPALKRLLANPNLYDLKGLCLIPFVDELGDVEILKAQGAIVSWDELQTAIEDAKTSQNVSRRYLKRLQAGLIQLEKTWREESLQNEQVQNQLDGIALTALREAVWDFEQYPEIKKKLEALRQIEIAQWFQNDDQLGLERRQDWDTLIYNRIWIQFLEDSSDQNPLALSLKINMQDILLANFKNDQLPEKFKASLNLENLSTLVYERVKNQKTSKALEKLIVSESNLIKQEEKKDYAFDKSTLHKKAVARLCEKWFKGEILDEEALKSINSIAGELLGKVSMDEEGELHAGLKKEAVILLLQQLREDLLSPMTEEALRDKIQLTLSSDKYTKEQKEYVVNEILKEFKEGNLVDKQLIFVCSGFLTEPMKLLQEEVECRVQRDPNRFFKDGEKLQDVKTEALKNSGQSLNSF